jgi:tRNA G18 (ribose-2'-O)-methylase SpoU
VLVQIEDPDDPAIAAYLGLRDRELKVIGAGADGLGTFVAESDLVVERALRAGYRMRSVLVDSTRWARDPLEVPPDVTVYAAAPPVVRAITGMGVHRGSLALFDRRPTQPVSELVERSSRLMVLDGVMNPINLGVMVRSAIGLGADGMVLDERCVDPLYRRSSRVSMGEVFAFPYAWSETTVAAIARARDAGFTTVALTLEEDAVDIAEVPALASERVALVFGSEGPGLGSEVAQACDLRATIPLRGEVDSLNVGAAAAVAMYVAFSA